MVKRVEQEAQKKPADPKEKEAIFCTMCFASDTDSSWGEQAIDGHCFNCGAGGCTIKIPRWAVENVRRNASWVGKRYYPADEDKEHYNEVRCLRGLMTEFPGRSARPTEDGKGWWVSQDLGKGTNVSVIVDAPSAEKALEKAKLSLPYVPKGGYKK